MHRTVKLYSLVIGATLFTLIVKWILISLNINVLETSGLVNALISASVFVLGIALNSVFQEYKEVHKLPGELSNYFESIFEDLKHIKNKEELDKAKKAYVNILSNFSHTLDAWSARKSKSKDVFSIIDELGEFISEYESTLPPNYITRMRNDLFNIRRIFIRFDYARDVSLSKYVEIVCWLFSGATLITVMLTKFETDVTGLWAVGIITIFFMSILRLIHIFDHPTEHKLIDFIALRKLKEKH